MISKHDHELVLQDCFRSEKRAALSSPDNSHLTGEIVNALTGHVEYAKAGGPPDAAKVIGHIQTAIGTGTLTRACGIATKAKFGAPVCQGDVIETVADSRIGLRLIDGTGFMLSGGARMVVDEFVCDANGTSHSALFGVTRGTFAFVVGEVAETGCLRIDTPVGSIRGRARTGGIGMLSLTALIFSLMKEVQAAEFSSQRPLLDSLDDDNIKPKDLQLNGTVDLVTRDGRHYTLDDPSQTIVISGSGSISVVTNSATQMAELQRFQQEALAAYTLGTGPTSTGGGGSSTPPSLLLSPEGLQPINFIESAPTVPQNSPSITTASVVGISVTEAIVVHSAPPPPSPPSLTAPAGLTNIDTAVFDTFAETGGTFHATDPNGGTALTFGISGGTTGGSTALGGVTYDVSDAGPYGTLYLNSSTGAYTYVPNSGAINALTAPTTENFIITVSDGTLSTNQTFTVTLNGANDAPTLAAVTGPIDADTAALDHFNAVTGVLAGADVDLPAQTLTYGIVGGTTGGSIVLGGVTYDVSEIGTYGTLYLNSTTGAYTFVPNDTAINALTAPTTENFTFTASDGTLSTNQTLTVTLNGANDAPTLAPVTGPTETDTAALDHFNAVTGVLTGTDVDLPAQTLTYGIVGGTADVSLSGYNQSLTDAYGKLYVNTATGAYTFVPNDTAINALATTTTENFTFTVSDGTLSANQVVTVTLNGTNDAPLITAQDLIGAVTEQITPAGNLSDSGLISFTDVDLTDVHLVSATGTPIGTTLGTLTAVKNTDTTGTGTGGQLTWTYTVAASAVEYLAAGQTKVESFTITLDDQHGGLITRQIDVTITGTNDAPLITAQDLIGAVTEQITPAGNLSDSGLISFTDVDLTDVHLVSATGTPIGTTLGTLTAVKNTDTTGTGTGGQLTWTYTVAASAVEYLAAGQTKVESFTITLDDQHGGLITRQIDVTITGTNDAPLITAQDLIGAVTEQITPAGNLSDSGLISFTDVDLTDVHLVSATGTPIGTTLGTLTAVKNTDTTGTGTGGQLTWTYTVAASAVEYLAAGQTKVESFTITLDDQHGGLITRQIDVTITGTNDAPLITAQDLIGAVTEQITPAGNLSDSGLISFTDVDLTDVHLVSATGTPIGTTLGTLTAVKNTDTTGTGTGGQLTWTYTVAASAVEYLAAGQTKVESFTITLDDQHGGLITRQIDVTITGTNDAPLITAQDLIGAVTEQITPAGNLSDSGLISFTDVDLTDVHLVSATGTPIGTTLGTLTAVKNTDTTGTGTGGQLTWTYTVAASAVEYLAAGQTKVESFTITLDDQHGGLITRQIDVTITGTNDAPLITAQDLIGAVTEQITPAGNLSDSGLISFTDVDLTDVHLVSATGTPIGTTLGTLTAVKNTDTTGTGTGGQLTWTYTVAASAVEYLAAGQTKVESFTITLDDQHGGLITRQIDVTITGTNDAPLITAQDLIGAVTEQITPAGNLSDSGLISFTDVDLTDVHLVSATGTPIGTTLGTLTAVKNTDTTGTGTGGQLTWTYTVAASAVEYLAAGQTKVESFTITLDDQHGGLITRQIDVTITGTNDAPLITAQDLIGAVTEQITPAGNLSDSGLISFTDVDLTDVHLVSATGTPIGTTLGTLTAVKNTDTTGTGTGGQLTWTYTVAASAVEYLAAGQTKVESFTITLDDQHGGLITRQIDVTITGTNDAPLITAQDLIGAVTEQITPAGNLSDSGLISFTDVDLTDVHLVSATGTPIGTTLGTLTAVKNTDTTGTGTGGQLTWTYTVAASAVEYLAAGQTKVESFTITLDDQHGGLITRQIDVTITGTNDAPLITAQDLIGAVTEQITPAGNLSDSGLISFTDVDLTDVHLVSATGTPIGTTLGTLTAVKNTDTTGTGTGGQLTWTYTVAASAVEYLAAGQTKVESFTITLDDQHGGLITRQIDVTITGTNDAPLITAQDLIGAVTEQITPAGNLSDSGLISFTDVDLTDVHLVSATGTPIGTTLGTLTAVKNTDTTGTGTGGQLTWTYTVADSAVEYLAAGQTKVESFTITLDDQHGGLITRQIDVTITGTNDAPVITAQDLIGAVTEQVTPAGNLSDSGVISFTDVDLTDVHLVSATGTPIGTTLGTLTAVKNTDTTGTGTGGQLTWTYTVAASAVEYLAAGQTKVESFTITLDDQHGGLITRQIDVTITGTNDAPLITAQDLIGAVTEQITPAGNLSDSGLISFTDVDLTDVHLVSATGTPIGTTLGTLTAVKNTDTTGTGTGGQLTWTYTVAASAVEYLAAGQTKVESFTITLDDQHGGLITRQIDVTITGTNDAPLITAQDLIGAVTEQITPAGNLSDSGLISFTDVDLTDVHLVSATGTPIGTTLGTLTAVKNTDTTGTGTGGQLTWTYTVAASAVEYLAAGQTKVESFTITLDDQHGGLITRQIDVTITGTNDAPMLSDTTGTTAWRETSGTGPNTAVVIDSALTVTDPDNTTLASAKVSITTGFVSGEDVLGFTANAALYGNITALYSSATGVLTLTSAGSSATLLQWQAALDAVTYNNTSHNPTGTSRTIRFVANDGQLESNAGTKTVSITPTNNAPSVTAGGTVTFTCGTAVVLDAGLKVTDVDSGNLTGATVSISAGLLAGDTLNFINQNGITGAYANGILTLSGTATVAQYQAALESITYSFNSPYGDPTALGTDDARTIAWVVNDGSAINGASTPATSALTVGDSWTHSGDGLWITSSDWSNGVPTQNENVAIDAIGTYTVTSTTNVDIGNLFVKSGVTLLAAPHTVFTVEGNLVNNGTVTAGPFSSNNISIIDIKGNVSGTGALDIFNHATIEIGGPVSPGQTVTFAAAGGAALLILDDSHDFQGTVVGLTEFPTESLENHVDLKDLKFVSGHMSAHFSNGVVRVSNGTDFVSLKVSGSSDTAFEIAKDATGGTLIDDPSASSGTVTIDSGETLDISGASTATVSFTNGNGSTGELVLDDPTAFTGHIVGFTGTAPDAAHSDTIDLVGIDFNSSQFVESYNSSTGLLTVSDGTHNASFTFDNFNATLDFASDGNGGTLITDPPASGISGAATTAPAELGIKFVDDTANVISGTSASVTLNNQDNTISGSGQLGNGEMGLTNAGTIEATGTHALVIDTGSHFVFNFGTLEASGSGGLTIASAIVNSGSLWANGANLTVHGDVSGNGTAIIDGGGTVDFAAASSANVVFSAGAAGTLKLEDSFHFRGTISGFSEADAIDLTDMNSATVSIAYHQNSEGTGGVLAVSDGIHATQLSFLGHYSADNFNTIPDHVRGTLVTAHYELGV